MQYTTLVDMQRAAEFSSKKISMVDADNHPLKGSLFEKGVSKSKMYKGEGVSLRGRHPAACAHIQASSERAGPPWL